MSEWTKCDCGDPNCAIGRAEPWHDEDEPRDRARENPPVPAAPAWLSIEVPTDTAGGRKVTRTSTYDSRRWWECGVCRYFHPVTLDVCPQALIEERNAELEDEVATLRAKVAELCPSDEHRRRVMTGVKVQATEQVTVRRWESPTQPSAVASARGVKPRRQALVIRCQGDSDD